MKIISIIKDKHSPKGFAYLLGQSVTTKEYCDFIESYAEFLEPIIQQVINLNSKMTFDIENPPEIWRLKLYMKQAHTVKQWNSLREKAKELFSKEAVRDLDASGYINQCI